jgi:Tfp pilus assembly protein PilN
LPYIEYFLSERFGVPVHKFNPFQNVGLGPGLDVQGLSRIASSFGEVVGLALRSSARCPVEVSLVPPSVAKRRETGRQKPAVYVALAACFLVFGLLIGYLEWQLSQTRQTTVKVARETEELQAVAIKQRPGEVLNADLKQRYDLAEKIFTQRDEWVRLLRDINTKIPPEIWITVLTPTYGDQPLDSELAQSGKGVKAPANPANPKSATPGSEGYTGAPEINQIHINGLFEKGATDVKVNEFVKDLADLDWFDIDPQKVAESIVTIEPPTRDSDQLTGKFQLRLKLKKPISLVP